MNITLENLYLLRIDFDCFIVTGYEIRNVMDNVNQYKIIKVTDIANNFLSKPCTEDTKISFQELYHIKEIVLQ